MAAHWLLGVPAKLTTLLNRLTSVWAAKLDTLATDWTTTRAGKLDTIHTNMDVVLSTRAAASTALSTATWTDTRAVLVDSIAYAAIVGKPPSELSIQVSKIGGSGLANEVSIGGTNTIDITSGSMTAVISYTGKGVLEWLSVFNSYTVSISMGAELWIDGVKLSERIYASAAQSDHYLLAGLSGSLAGVPISMSPVTIPFSTSLVIKGQTSSSGKAKLLYRFRKVA